MYTTTMGWFFIFNICHVHPNETSDANFIYYSFAITISNKMLKTHLLLNATGKNQND